MLPQGFCLSTISKITRPLNFPPIHYFHVLRAHPNPGRPVPILAVWGFFKKIEKKGLAMNELYTVPKNFRIDYSELSVLPRNAKLLVMFFYAQRGRKINADCIQMALGLSRNSIRNAIKTLIRRGEINGER